MCFSVFSWKVLKCEADAEGPKLSRQKREWIRPPKTLTENTDYSGQIIAKVRILPPCYLFLDKDLH